MPPAHLHRLDQLRVRLTLLHARSSSTIEHLDRLIAGPRITVADLGDLQQRLLDLRDDWAAVLDPVSREDPS